MKKSETNSPSAIALFDFDGTITKKDSFLAFLKYTHGFEEILKRFLYLWPVLLLYKLKILTNSTAKKIVFRSFYRNWQARILNEKAVGFCTDILPSILNNDAIKKLRWHQQQSHRVIIISAMFESILQPWCTENNVELIATRLEIKNGKLTGNFSTPNCYGKEKLNRITQAGLLENSTYVFAYGDSAGDKEMLNLANEAFYRRF